ncbi:MAG: heparan-alpha-glucosaminide N-acetyltransferase domain-containing protein [Muribaculaceae bacterium]|nr:heparan-alpha-glucosaminide N-acetyltransferase domain-containing protein [Muribaculaceae bacterium]
MTECTAIADKQRLKALDVFRGLTVAAMILVNNPGSWANIYAPLRHASWNGLTPTDLVFPFFMFIMGVSACFSMRRYDYRLTTKSLWKVLRRTIVIFLIGLAIVWFARFVRGVAAGKPLADCVFTFGTIRVLGVFPRLALCYGIGTILALLIPRKALGWTVTALLTVYALVLLLGRGYEFSTDNIIYIVDNYLIGPNHLYTDTIDGVSLKLDPEGLLSTVPSIAHMLIGWLCGGMILRHKDNNERCCRLFVCGTALLFAGLLLSYGLPLNKKIWSPTFVLTTCGMAASVLALMIWIIDVRGHSRWTPFFEVIGVNPLFVYCVSTVLAIVFGVKFADTSVHRTVLDAIYAVTGDGQPKLASLIYALLFLGLNWAIGYILYLKKIYIKI